MRRGGHKCTGEDAFAEGDDERGRQRESRRGRYVFEEGGGRNRTRAEAADVVCHLGVERQRGRGGGKEDGFLWAAASGRAGLLIGGDSGLER